MLFSVPFWGIQLRSIYRIPDVERHSQEDNTISNHQRINIYLEQYLN